MEAIVSRKARDAEIGLAKKHLEETIAYWGVNWNVRTLEELPEYVQDLYILYTYSLWLEDQIALHKMEDKEEANEILNHSGTGSGNDNNVLAGDARPVPDTNSDTGTDSTSKPHDGIEHPAADGGTGSTGLRTGNASVYVQPELPIQSGTTHTEPKQDV